MTKTKLFSDLGKLSVKGTQLVDTNDNPVILRGISSIGIAWYPEYICKETFAELRDSWGLTSSG